MTRWLAIAVFLIAVGGPSVTRAQWFKEPDPAGFDLGCGIRFTADAFLLNQQNSTRTIPIVSGPESVFLGDVDFGWEPGTRLGIAYLEGDYEFTLSYLFLNKWNEGSSGFLTRAVDFDGPTAYNAAALASRLAVDPTGAPNFLTPGTVFAPMFTAANASGETDALEFLRPGAGFKTEYTTDVRDIEANLTQRRQPGRLINYGLGFRHLDIRETAFATLNGIFGTVDADGAGVPLNNGLSNGSITGAGLTLISDAATTANGFSDANPAVPTAADELLFRSNTVTNNHLNGLQATFEFVYDYEVLRFRAFGKPGVYLNTASGQISEIYADTLNDKSTYQRILEQDRQQFSFLGHIGAEGQWFVMPKVAITLGYELFWITGLALAPEQQRQISTPVPGAAALDLRATGTMLLHGGRLGVEFLF